MAESLSRARRNIAGWGIFLSGMAVVGATAYAEILTDPTRPPNAIVNAQETGGGEIASGPVLQSIIMSPRRTVATISGQTLKVGEKIGDAYVVAITENEVVLRTGKESKTLKLFPGVEKRLISNRTASKPESQEQKR